MTMVSNYATAAEQSGLYLIAIWRVCEDWLLVMKTLMMAISPDMYSIQSFGCSLPAQKVHYSNLPPV